ncbi:Trs33p Ecym_5425 [Eremothecium cymbalariae DBVPG|uniref:Trafficking protein particle complex subunit n=1 Tax=Eremothecium cymbalariae (strain CBS 270.75 / DBVPG 7215 / KCTC 17166 / NRRL Y-17582) TaxID=931890 RepID=I6NDN7_ERECY|nr:hypothetical protein Ecym_5425 [Eremothecium cymbalariae DBVPG\
MEGNNKSGSEPQLDEHTKLQHQFKLFQESLPKVSIVAYQLLLNELVPLSVSIENNIQDMTSSIEVSDEDTSTETETETECELSEQLERMKIEEAALQPSHKLIQELYEANDSKRDHIYERLSQIGFQIGSKLTELLIYNNNPNLHFESMDLLAVMKFICRDVWKQLFGKQIDNLKTNHRGTFYLFDYDYQPIQDFSLDGEISEKELQMVEPYLEIPCGIIKGILASLGFKGDDQVDVTVSFVDIPKDRVVSPNQFSKGINFNVQVTRTE